MKRGFSCVHSIHEHMYLILNISSGRKRHRVDTPSPRPSPKKAREGSPIDSEGYNSADEKGKYNPGDGTISTVVS